MSKKVYVSVFLIILGIVLMALFPALRTMVPRVDFVDDVQAAYSCQTGTSISEQSNTACRNVHDGQVQARVGFLGRKEGSDKRSAYDRKFRFSERMRWLKAYLLPTF